MMTKLALAFTVTSACLCLQCYGIRFTSTSPSPHPAPPTNLTRHETRCDWTLVDSYTGDEDGKPDGREKFNQAYGTKSCSPGSRPGCNQHYDLYTSSAAFGEGAAPVPLAVYVHSGSWWVFDKSEPSRIPEVMAVIERGMHLVSINYRLVPEVAWPELTNDVAEAMTFFKSPEFTQAYNIDPNRVFLMGCSAGGQLVTEVATRLASPGSPARPVAVINIFGAVVLWHSSEARSITDMLNCSTPDQTGTECNEKANQGSADKQIDDQSAPILSLYGRRDPLHLAGQALDAAAQQVGAHHTFIDVPRVGHSFGRIWQGRTNGICNVDVMYNWLYERLEWYPQSCEPCPNYR